MKYGIITAKQLLYFKMAGAICSLCSLPHGQLYHFTRCVHGIITAKPLLYFSAPTIQRVSLRNGCFFRFSSPEYPGRNLYKGAFPYVFYCH